MLKRYEFLGETTQHLHHMRGIIGQSCGGANREVRPQNGSKVLQRSGSSATIAEVRFKIYLGLQYCVPRVQHAHSIQGNITGE